MKETNKCNICLSYTHQTALNEKDENVLKLCKEKTM